MKNRFIIDVTTGGLSRTIGGVELQSSLATTFTVDDILDCEVIFKAGTSDITEALLGDGRVLKLGLRKNTSEGPILAQSEPHTLNDGIAECRWSLKTAPMAALVDSIEDSNARSVKVWFEAEVSHTTEGVVDYRQTFAQQKVTLVFEVNMDGDEPPPTAEQSAITATQAKEAAEAARDVTLAARDDARAAKEDAEAAAEALQPGLHVLTDGATVAWDVAHPVAKLTLGGNRTLEVTNLQAGATYILFLVQDATGSRTLTWPAAVKWQAGIAPSLTTAAGKTDIFTFTCDGANLFGTYLLNF